jgi:glycosyltransferase involved in cell wall biosynthesis
VNVPLVSVVIPAYHRQARFLAAAIESVLGQSYSPLEAVLVHDGSDEVLKILAAPSFDGRLRTYREKGPGYIAALNQGIELARGDYVAFCDSDDLLNSDHVNVLARTLAQSPDAGLAFDNLIYLVDEACSEPNGLDRLRGLNGRPLISAERSKNLLARGVRLQDVFLENLISGPAFMVPKRIFDAVGLFDDAAFLMNDLHLFYRIGSRFPLRYADYVGVRKRVHADNLTTTHPHYEYGLRSLENIRERYPEVYRRLGREVFGKKLARKYYRLGLYCERTGDRARAKLMYRNAMLARKLSLRYHWAYFRSAIFR